MNTTISIIIIDDLLPDDDPVIALLKRDYHEVKLIKSPQEGIEYITSHLSYRHIVILDYKFAQNEPDGAFVLEKIREKSKIIPVILWTANGNMITELESFINNKAFAMVPKAPYEELLSKIKEAENFINNSVEGALEEWIKLEGQESLERPFLIAADGKEYTLAQLLSEIRMQSNFGKKIEKDLLMLTIDLLIRKKENLK